MAPISQIFAWTALAAIASARPLVNPQQMPGMVTETAWATVDVLVTLWVDEHGTPLSTVAPGGNFAAMPTFKPSTFVTSTSTPPAVSNAAPSVASVAPIVQSSSSVAPVSTQAPIQAPAPPPSPTTTPYVAPTSATPTTTPAPPAIQSSQAQVGRQATTAAAAAATPAAAAGGSSGSVSASSTNMCTGTSDACSGDITHYDGGLGACGWNVNSATDMQIALPYEFMGTQSNGNPYCGKSLTIMNPTTGQTIQATVGDKCMGCTGRSIDLTDAAFNAVGNGCDGRCHGFEWWFN